MSAVEMADRAAIRKELLQRRHWHDKEYCFKISVRAALRDRGDSAKAAIMDELENIVDKGVFHGVHMRDLTSAQRKTILRSVTFLKDKYTASGVFDKFKARLCVNGSGQDHEMYTDVVSHRCHQRSADRSGDRGPPRCRSRLVRPGLRPVQGREAVPTFRGLMNPEVLC
jgi:hypothetical protein